MLSLLFPVFSSCFIVLLCTFLSSFLPNLITALLAYIPSMSGLSYTLPYSGLAAWIALKLRFGECLAMVISLGVTKIMLRSVPIVGRWFAG